VAKPKFDPKTIEAREPSGLAPLDFMRPLSQPLPHPAVPAAPAPTVEAPAAERKQPRAERPAVPASEPKDLPMPPTRQVQIRVPIGARIPPELSDRLRQFVHEHNVNMQDTIELAIDEFLARRKR
jgi:hypothetical protein